MKIKTSELTGLGLVYALAKAKGWLLHKDATLDGHHMRGWFISGHHPDPNHWCPIDITPARLNDLAKILDEEEIDLRTHRLAEFTERGTEILRKVGWIAFVSPSAFWMKPRFHQEAKTPLLAVQRCLVEMKLGDEVDVPEELLS